MSQCFADWTTGLRRPQSQDAASIAGYKNFIVEHKIQCTDIDGVVVVTKVMDEFFRSRIKLFDVAITATGEEIVAILGEFETFDTVVMRRLQHVLGSVIARRRIVEFKDLDIVIFRAGSENRVKVRCLRNCQTGNL